MTKHSRVEYSWNALIVGRVAAVQVGVADSRRHNFDDNLVVFQLAQTHVFDGPFPLAEGATRDKGFGFHRRKRRERCLQVTKLAGRARRGTLLLEAAAPSRQSDPALGGQSLLPPAESEWCCESEIITVVTHLPALLGAFFLPVNDTIKIDTQKDVANLYKTIVLIS